MSRGVDWKQAMLNEAEASGDEGWAAEARKEASGWRYSQWELWRIIVATVLLLVLAFWTGMSGLAVVSGIIGWLPALLLFTVLYGGAGLAARWFAGKGFDPAFAAVLLISADNAPESWPLQGWAGILSYALPLVAACLFGYWLGGRWQPFGAWRSYDPADFAEK